MEYLPAVAGNSKVHFVQAASGIDHWMDVSLLKPADESAAHDFWANSTTLPERLAIDSQPEVGASFAELPAKFAREKSYQEFRRDLAEHLYRMCILELWHSELLDLTSNAGESEGAFRRRLEPAVSARREAERQKIEQQFSTKLSRLEDRIQAAQAKADTQKWQFWSREQLRLGTRRWCIAAQRRWPSRPAEVCNYRDARHGYRARATTFRGSESRKAHC